MNMNFVPKPEEVVQYAIDMNGLKKQFDDAIRLTNDLGYAMDLAGIMFSGNSYGTKIQSWLERKYGWDPIPQTLNEGDFHGKNNPLVELKVSILSLHSSQANFLNLRLDTKVEQYLFIIRSTQKQYTKIFFAPKEAVRYMVDTFKEGRYNKHKVEHANIRVDVDSILWDDDPELNMWSYLHQYEITEEELSNI